MYLGLGLGSMFMCVLVEELIDFLCLLVIGYDEICWFYELEFVYLF